LVFAGKGINLSAMKEHCEHEYFSDIFTS
jgi:hypothetical protein